MTLRTVEQCNRVPFGISRRRVVLGAAALAAWPLGGCGGGAAVAQALYAPFFVFAFEGVVGRRRVNVAFTPDAASTDQPSGDFDPDNSFISVSDPNDAGFFVNSNFSGTFDERDMQITLAAPQAPLVASYAGRFTDDETVVLTPAGGAAGATITVRRNRNDSFLPTLTGDWTGEDASGAAWQVRLDTEPPNSDFDATVLLVGSEVLAAAAAVPLTGYASIRYIELVIERADGDVVLTGTLEPSAVPPAQGDPQVTETIVFDGGGSLRRVV